MFGDDKGFFGEHSVQQEFGCRDVSGMYEVKVRFDWNFETVFESSGTCDCFKLGNTIQTFTLFQQPLEVIGLLI